MREELNQLPINVHGKIVDNINLFISLVGDIVESLPMTRGLRCSSGNTYNWISTKLPTNLQYT